jgi:hypothetical protein
MKKTKYEQIAFECSECHQPIIGIAGLVNRKLYCLKHYRKYRRIEDEKKSANTGTESASE